MVNGVAEPDPDRGDIDGSAVDVVAFVGAHGHGSVAPELVDGSLDRVAVAVGHRVELRPPAALAAAPGAVGDVVRWFGNGGLDAASPQVSADLLVRVSLVGQHPA